MRRPHPAAGPQRGLALPVTERPARRPARKQVLLRLDPAVHDALASWAADELRSTNAQVDYLLRRALADAGRR
ncbi:type II toxin-antitoxin system antitoxin, partial [Streptomyces sparsus]